MTISRDTFDAAKNYKRIRYHQDRCGYPRFSDQGLRWNLRP